MKFRKKPVEVDARQWTGANQGELMQWATQFGSEGRLRFDDGDLSIDTLAGELRAGIGDWVICGVTGELYPCNPEIFAVTYEPITEDVGPAQ